MPKDLIQIDVSKDRDDRRAKHASFSVNKKHIDFPLKAVQLSSSNQNETSIASSEIDRKLINEYVIQIRPKRLREIVKDDTLHQNTKDTIRRILGDTSSKGINAINPLLINQRTQYESENDFEPFPKPSVRIIEKLFDLFDMNECDMLITPVALDDKNEMQWAKMSAEIFSSRKPDFLDEFILSGLVPGSVSEGMAIQMNTTYIENGFESLTFDFAGRKVRETRMRNIIDSNPIWDELYVHGTNVPHYNWQGTFRNPVMPTYDLLVSVYGFDSYSNLRMGFGGGGGTITPEKVFTKMKNKRYRIIDSYGTYNKEGLTNLIEQHNISCKCPICRPYSSPIDIYDRPVNTRELFVLGDEMKNHRLHVTHGEIKKVASLIDKGKYHEYLIDKKDATKELNAISSSIHQGKRKK